MHRLRAYACVVACSTGCSGLSNLTPLPLDGGGTAGVAGGGTAGSSGGGAGIDASTGGSAGAGGSDAGFDALPVSVPQPIAYYGLDAADVSASTLVDRMGNHPGTIFGAPTTAAGKVKEAFVFDGKDDYVELDAFPQLDKAFSIAAWCVLDTIPANPANPAIIDKWSWHTIERSFSLGTSYQQLAAQVSRSGGLAYALLASEFSVAPVGQWTHLAMTFDNGDLRLYRDGKQAASQGQAAEFSVFKSTIPVWIGRSRSDGAPEQEKSYWDGMLDEIVIWDRGLTDAQVSKVFEKGTSGQPAFD